ncbi:hypothetical protein [Streptomyces rapamycinicus]|uniref:Secreted protein n=1 Tax=Streptomyces rapamycinicus TaxID=1226757 RepID=A0ABR6M3V3_9ACTN|nr:hypothetical protein [Streptomyces rapamycinicus]MBB4789268.1 hypothetical protein [Streptomyces rapamycinicus]UTO67278.1 hypothetical protein LJB45_36585 [Streptomyces rapamycinicus]UTP35236.1 hypothetical protein LIV37_41720 [Streptomyces rapamycinicus NRRL 5491]
MVAPVAAAVLCVLGLSVTVGSPAWADSTAGGDLQVAQTLGDRDLTLILRRVTGLPGPLRVDVLTHRGTAAGTLRLGAVPTGASADRAEGSSAGTTTSTVSVKLGSTPGSYGAALDIDRAGPWELVVDDGSRTARIPFTVPGQATSPPELAVFGGFVTAGVLMLVTLFVAVRARRGAWALLPAGGVVAALAVAVTAALLSTSLPLPPEPGGQVDATNDNVTDPYSVVRPVTNDYSRPPASLELGSYPAKAAERGTLRLSVNDGSTGLPADDLIVHDGALMHLLVIGPTGELWHLHPIRTAPGTYEVQLRLPAVGHYAVSAEFARRGGGIQHVRSATGLTVADGSTRGGVPALPAELAPRGPGTRTIDGVPVRLTAPSPRAGEASTLTARVGDTRTLQPWLGMVGHMIVVGPLDRADATSPTRMGQAAQGAPVWAHAHSMGGDMSGDPTPGMAGAPDHDMAAMRHGAHSGGDEESMDSMSGLMPLNGDSPADETVAAYGPDASFVYTFSRPGYYRVWIQAERDSAILTVPYLLRVSPAAGAAK